MDNNFLTRWSLRKLQQQEEVEQELPIDSSVESIDGANPIDSQVDQQTLNVSEPLKEIDYGANEQGEPVDLASLLMSEATGSVKKQALRKLFMSGEFHEVDKLNDYDHDYKAVKPLAVEVVNSMRQWLNEPESNVINEEPINEGNELGNHTPDPQYDESTPLIDQSADISEFEVNTNNEGGLVN